MDYALFLDPKDAEDVKKNIICKKNLFTKKLVFYN